MIRIYFEDEHGDLQMFEDDSKCQYNHALIAMGEAEEKGWKHIETVRYDEDGRKY